MFPLDIPTEVRNYIQLIVDEDESIETSSELNDAIRFQVTAYRYMQHVQNSDIKMRAIEEHPRDFVSQKYEYETELRTQLYIESVADKDIVRQAKLLWPDSFFMQKTYCEMELFCKYYMDKADDADAKQRAKNEKPQTYSTLKELYDNIVYGDPSPSIET